MSRGLFWYHIALRNAAVVIAFVLLFDSGLLGPVAKQLADGTEVYLANVVGVGASVQPTELNSITAALTEREQALAEREAALTQRELAVGLNAEGANSQGDLSTYIISSLLFIILVLIVLNYILDFTRAGRVQERRVVL